MGEAARRPKDLNGITYRVKMPHCGSLFVTVNLPLEVMMHMGRSGECTRAWIEAVGRLISLALRNGVAADDIVKELKGIRCAGSQPPSRKKGQGYLSCPDAIGRSIEESLGVGDIEVAEGHPKEASSKEL
jgi:ribonucleoside-diphosphate reductase alpha chain